MASKKTSSRPSVSVVVATYNRAHTLPRCIDSILSQTYPFFEIVVVDDGSTDETKTVVSAYRDARMRYHRLDKNKGATTARNAGIELARGEFIMVWDSDDELMPHALERVVEIFDTHPEADVVSAPAKVIAAGREVVYPTLAEGWVTLPQILCKELPSNEKVRVARRTLFSDVRYRSKHIDFLVNVELRERGRWYHLAEPLCVVHTGRGDSLTRARRRGDARASIDRAPHLVSFLEKHGARLLASCPAYYAAYAYGAAVGLLLEGEQARGRYWARRSVRANPLSPRHFLLLGAAYVPFGRQLLNFLFSLKALV